MEPEKVTTACLPSIWHFGMSLLTLRVCVIFHSLAVVLSQIPLFPCLVNSRKEKLKGGVGGEKERLLHYR